MIKKFVYALFGLAFAYVFMTYAMGLLVRSNHLAWNESFSTEDGGLYYAKYSNLPGNQVLLRIYRTADRRLLAERTFSDFEWRGPIWLPDYVIYGNGQDSSLDDGSISLPPGMLDRVRALIP